MMVNFGEDFSVFDFDHFEGFAFLIQCVKCALLHQCVKCALLHPILFETCCGAFCNFDFLPSLIYFHLKAPSL